MCLINTIWAKIVKSPTCLIRVDFPPIFGPVNRDKDAQSFALMYTVFGMKLSSPMQGWRLSSNLING